MNFNFLPLYFTLVFSIAFSVEAGVNQNPFNIKVLTFNVHDLPAVPMDRNDRIPEVCESFRKLTQGKNEGPDVILVQELWSKKYREEFKKDGCGYPYHVDLDDEGMPEDLSVLEIMKNMSRIFFTKEKMGTGLFILSKYPVVEAHKYVYSHNGNYSTLTSDGEAAVGKGAYGALISIPHFDQKILIVNTHLVSSYEHNDYKEEKSNQMSELISFVSNLRAKYQIPVILGGDFNMDNPPLETFYELKKNIITISEDNPYVQMQNEKSASIDHIGSTNDLLPLKVKRKFDQMVETKDGKSKFFLSDHFALQVHFVLNSKEQKISKL